MAAKTIEKPSGRRGKGAKASPNVAPNGRGESELQPPADAATASDLAADQVAIGSSEELGAAQSVASDFVVMSVKMRRAEADAFRALCVELDVSVNRALRTMARHASGYLEIGGTVEDELRAAVRQLRGVATNVNQIAKAANRTRTLDYADFMRERAALGPVLLRLSIQCRRILDVSARRLDGRERLKAVLQRSVTGDMVNERA